MAHANETPDFGRIQKIDSVWDFMNMKLISVFDSPYGEDGPPCEFTEQIQISLFAGHCPEENRFYDFLYDNMTVREFLNSAYDIDDFDSDCTADKFTFPRLQYRMNSEIREYIVKVFTAYGMRHLVVYYLPKNIRISCIPRIVSDFGKDYLLCLPSMVAGVEKDEHDYGYYEEKDPAPSFFSVRTVLRDVEDLSDWEINHRDEMIETMIDSGCFTMLEIEEASKS